MRALVYRGPTDVVLEDVPPPTAGPGQVVIAVRWAGICGSDLTIFQGRHARAKPPLVLGHEFAGLVAEVGPGVDDLAPGERVTAEPLLFCGRCPRCLAGDHHLCAGLGLYGIDAPGGFAELVAVDRARVMRLPESLSLEHGALVEPLAVGVHAARLSGLGLGERALVLGGGPIGLLTAQAALAAGAAGVAVIEPSPHRRRSAQAMGLPVFDNAAMPSPERMVGGAEVDVVFEAAGRGSALDLAQRLVRRGGRVVVVGIHKQPAALDAAGLTYGETRLIGSFCYRTEDFRAALDLAAQGRIPLGAIVSHRLPLAEGSTAMAGLVAGGDAQKILLGLE